VLWFLIHSMIIIIDGLNDENTRSDIGVIFGNKVNPDGSLSERLEKRCDKGIEMYKDSLVGLIVVSGGFGKEGHYEGTKMHDYLVSKGVPKDKIIIDNLGNTTEATADNIRRMNLSANSITVITQYHHISRAKLAFKNNGYEKVYGGHADYFELRDIYSIVREFLGYYKYLLLN
jgi:vancomycin permeability regulator SanA